MHISTSKGWKLDTIDLTKSVKGLGIALVGAAGVTVLSYLTQMDFGEVWTPLIGAGISALYNVLRKWINHHDVQYVILDGEGNIEFDPEQEKVDNAKIKIAEGMLNE